MRNVRSPSQRTFRAGGAGEVLTRGRLSARSGNRYHSCLLAKSSGKTMKIDGRCHCGYVCSEAEADPETTTICNCTDCQTMSGAPLRAVIITQPGTFVLLSGKPTEYRKTADSGNVRLQAFCPKCGTAIYAASTGDEPKAYKDGMANVLSKPGGLHRPPLQATSLPSQAIVAGPKSRCQMLTAL